LKSAGLDISVGTGVEWRLMEGNVMREVNVEEYLKHEVTDEEAKANAEWFKQWCKEADKANQEEPLDEDFEEFQRKYKCLPV
jgi:hypothetical protein